MKNKAGNPGKNWPNDKKFKGCFDKSESEECANNIIINPQEDEMHMSMLAFFIPESARFEAVFQAVVCINKLYKQYDWQPFKDNILTNWDKALKHLNPPQPYGFVTNKQLIAFVKAKSESTETKTNALENLREFMRKLIPEKNNQPFKQWRTEILTYLDEDSASQSES